MKDLVRSFFGPLSKARLESGIHRSLKTIKNQLKNSFKNKLKNQLKSQFKNALKHQLNNRLNNNIIYYKITQYNIRQFHMM